MKKYLIAIDLDGTLLPDLYTLTDFDVKVFTKLKEMGQTIVITTGRPNRSSCFVYQKFGLNTPLINYNGSLISNPSDPLYPIFSDEMKREDILRLYNMEKDRYSIFFSEHNDTIYSNIDDPKMYELMHYSSLAKLISGDLNEILDTNVHGTLILAKTGCGKLIEDDVNKNFKSIGARMWSWGPYKEIVELCSLKSSKGSAIKLVSEQLGFKKEEIIACGDSKNDLEFFDEAGTTVCLSNSEDAIKAKATYVYPVSCSDEGLAKFFVSFFNLKM